MGRGEYKSTAVGDDLDMHTYQGVTVGIVTKILRALTTEGMAVTGKNPWAVDVGKHDVKLRAVWNPATQVLAVAIVDHDWMASSFRIWGEIDPLLNDVIRSGG